MVFAFNACEMLDRFRGIDSSDFWDSWRGQE